jgi:hypothetical protein
MRPRIGPKFFFIAGPTAPSNSILKPRRRPAALEAAGFRNFPVRSGRAFDLQPDFRKIRSPVFWPTRCRAGVRRGRSVSARGSKRRWREIDVAQPEFSLRGRLRRRLAEPRSETFRAGKPIAARPAEIQRWLQTGQTHTRTAEQRVLLVPTEAWSEMREVLADCAVEQEPGKIRVARTFAPYLAGALTAQGFRADGKCRRPISRARCEEPRSMRNCGRSFVPTRRRGRVAGGSRATEFSRPAGRRHGPGQDAAGAGVLRVAEGGGRSCPTPRCPRKSGRRSPGDGQLLVVLVVCPTSLVTNWLREAARFTPHLRALDLTGADRAEKFAAGKNEYDLLVTSYAILRRDVEHYRAENFRS